MMMMMWMRIIKMIIITKMTTAMIVDDDDDDDKHSCRYRFQECVSVPRTGRDKYAARGVRHTIEHQVKSTLVQIKSTYFRIPG